MNIKLRKLAFALILLVLIYPAQCISLGISGGDGGSSGFVNMKIDAEDSASVQGKATVSGAEINPSVSTKGKLKVFEQTHGATDPTGKHAEVYVKVVNGQNIKYSSKVLPKEGNLRKVQTSVSAEEWLSTSYADYIQCKALASYPVGCLSAGVQMEVTKGSVSGYHNKAYATTGYVEASQEIKDSGKVKKGITGQEISLDAWSSNEACGSAKVNAHVREGSVNAFCNFASTTPLDPIASVTGLDACGKEVQVTGTDSEGLDWYALRACMFGDSCTPAVFKGDAVAETGQGAKMTIASASGTDAMLQYDKNVGGNPQQVILHSKDGSIAGIATSSDSVRILQDAINIAEGGDTINVGRATYEGGNVIDKSLTIAGFDPEDTIVDGADTDRGFTIGASNTKAIVTISGLGIKNCRADDGGIGGNNGGSIWNAATLTLENCHVLENDAKHFGGGIYNKGKVTVRDCTISENEASECGGGIFNYLGTATITDSTISGNKALNGDGGGIYNIQGTATVIGSTISENEASESGGGIFNFLGIATITDSTIYGNNAESFGGGIENIAGSTAMITNSIISANNADVDGGGIDNIQGTVTITDCVISGNQANDNGGGIANGSGTATIIRSTVRGNIANGDGGGIYTSSGQVALTGSTVIFNSANYGGGGGNGGGIKWIGIAPIIDASTVVSNTPDNINPP